MNEEQKNIETCLPENILAEVASVPTDAQFVSLVEESFDPLQQQAVQQAGSDAYNEVVASHQPYTFTSQVAQMKSNLILLLRRFWRFPFGSGTIRSLSDMWAHYITRLQGSETYGIPSRLDQLTDLPSAPLLVADRKIGGVPEAEDGMSLAQIIGGTSGITTITDNNDGWTLNTSRCLNYIKSIIPSLQTITMNCVKHTTDYVGYELSGLTPYFPKLKECGGLCYGMTFGDYELPDLEVGGTVFYRCSFNKLSLPNATHLYQQAFLAYSDAKELYFPKVTKLGVSGSWNGYYLMVASTQAQWDRLEKLVYGPLHEVILWSSNGIVTSSANLIHLEFGQGVDVSLNLSKWNPTNVLADQDLLQQFLSNFRSFIVLRLANRKTTTALTLTLSAAVYNAVTGANSGWASQHTLADLGITAADLTELETELGITSATIYATWLDTFTGANGIHWDINKAN